MHKILVIEDDINLAKGLAKIIAQYGLDPILLDQFDQIDIAVQKIQPHLILLDINLPFYNGFYWCTKIRKISLCPIIIISAKDETSDQIMALENGADDYICKPFYNDIVIAKIRSHLRRNYGDYKVEENNSIIEKKGLKLDKGKMTLEYLNNKASISHKEMVLIETLLEKYPHVVERELLLEKVWDNQNFVDENTLNVNIARLRKKLEEVGLKESLDTIRGYGYQLKL